MQDLELDTLARVTGGLSSQVSSSLNAVTSALNDFKYSQTNNNSSSNNLALPLMFLALNNNRRQQAVVSTPGATVVY